MDACEIFHIARKAIERLDDHYVEGSLPGLVQHPQKAFACHHRAA